MARIMPPMHGRIQWLTGARGLALFGVAAAFANCGGQSAALETPVGVSGAGVGNAGGEAAGGESGGRAEESGGVGGVSAAGEAGARAGGAASSGSSGETSGGESGAGGQSGEAGSGQAGQSGEGGSGGHVEDPCGNGRVEDGEECDDGNGVNGDGCSRRCGVESGFTCSAAVCDAEDGRCQRRLPFTVRDFNGHDVEGGHADFAPGTNSPGAMMGLVEAALDAEGKPVLVAESVAAFLHGAEAFAEWYRDTPGVNATVERELVLWNDGDGSYSNRWGANGERWEAPAQYANILYGGELGTGCSACTPSAAGACYDPCIPWGDGTTMACCAEEVVHGFDGSPLFFPIDDAPNALVEPRTRGKVPEQFGWVGWPWEENVASMIGVLEPIQTAWAPFPSAGHNFNFTTELRFHLVHDAKLTTKISLQGDDDIWVFVNGRLAVDLGSYHVPLPGSVTMVGDHVTTSAQLNVMTPPTVVTETRPAGDFGLVDGEPYEVAIFHADRMNEGATLQVGVSGVDWRKSVCVPE